MNIEAIKTLTARWATPEGTPFKGELISTDGCMCAQGQALHFIGGYSADDLRETKQPEADMETARLLGISTTHAILLRIINDSIHGAPSIVLTNPEKILGDQAPAVLAFWRHIDRMDDAAWAFLAAARDAAREAAWEAAGEAARDAAWATNEIQGAAIMRAKGQPFYFLPLFGFADPEAVLATDLANLETTPPAAQPAPVQEPTQYQELRVALVRFM